MHPRSRHVCRERYEREHLTYAAQSISMSQIPHMQPMEKNVCFFIVHMCLSGFADIVKTRHSQSWITKKKQCLSYSFDKTRRLHVPLMPCFFLSFILSSFIHLFITIICFGEKETKNQQSASYVLPVLLYLQWIHGVIILWIINFI